MTRSNDSTVRRFAHFARGLDGLFLDPAPHWDRWALIRGDSPEEDWIGPIVPRDRAIVFRLRGHSDDPYPSTGDVLHDSNIASLLRRRGIDSLLLSSSFTPETRQWTERHGVQMLATPFADQRRLENKLWFDRFLQRNGIRKPESTVVRADGGERVGGERKPSAWQCGPVVVQRADSLGGEGTYFLASGEAWPDLSRRLELPAGERLLMRRFVPGRSFGITVFVAPGSVVLSAVRRQCYFPRRDGAERATFAGIQWVASDELSNRLRRRIDATFLALGELLHRRHFVGFANCDFLADADDRVWLIECNPRMSAATPQLLARPELTGGVPVGSLFLDAFRGRRRWPRSPSRTPFPASSYRGATLELVHSSNERLTREPVSGPYRDREGDYAFYSLGRGGQRPTFEATLGIVLADFPLYDGEAPNAVARRLTRKFRYT